MTGKKFTNEIKTLKWMIGISGRSMAGAFVLLAIEMIIGASAALQALLFRNLIDTAVVQDFMGVAHAALGLAVLIIAVMLLGALNSCIKVRLVTNIENDFKHRLFDMVLSGDYAAVRSLHTGDWVTRLTLDTAVVADAVTSFIPNIGGIVARLVAAAVVLFVFDPVLGTFILLAGIVLMVPSGMMRKRFKQLHRAIQEADSHSREYAQERLENLPVVHSFAKEEDALVELDKLLGSLRTMRLKRNYTVNMFALVRGLLTRGAYGVAALWCVYGIYTGSMSYGTLMATLQLVTQMQDPLSSISGLMPGFYAAIASADRLHEAEVLLAHHDVFVQQAPEDANVFDAIGFDGVQFSYEQVEEEARARFQDAVIQHDGEDVLTPASESRLVPELELKSESEPESESESDSKFAPSSLIMHDINIHVPRGSYVGFTGPSGCGKSTVLKLFMCLYPIQGGMRYFDSAQGRRNLESCARWLFAYVPQGNMLMSGTIREVIALHDKDAMQQDSCLWDALRVSCADDFVRELEDGLDTKLGEHGAGLSEGQMQRIAIARAVFSDRPVLLLDECTSALDEETEARLLANLRSMTDKTVLIVTHRPAALDIVDAVVRFSQDSIVVEHRG